MALLKSRQGLNERMVGRLSDFPNRQEVSRTCFCMRERREYADDPPVYEAGGLVGAKPPAPYFYLIPNPANHSNSIRVNFVEVTDNGTA